MREKEQVYYSVTELCKILGINRTTFYKAKIGEALPAYKIGKRVKYKAEDIERLKIG